MTIQIADIQNLRATPTGMAPSSQAFFVPHAGHQTILDSRNPLARAAIGLIADQSVNPTEAREFRQRFATQVMEALGG